MWYGKHPDIPTFIEHLLGSRKMKGDTPSLWGALSFLYKVPTETAGVPRLREALLGLPGALANPRALDELSTIFPLTPVLWRDTEARARMVLLRHLRNSSIPWAGEFSSLDLSRDISWRVLQFEAPALIVTLRHRLLLEQVLPAAPTHHPSRARM